MHDAPTPIAPTAAERATQDEWLWGWDPTPGIVSVWADERGRAVVWRREPASGALIREEQRFRPWIVVQSLDDFAHLGARFGHEGEGNGDAPVTWRALAGDGELRFVVSAHDTATLHGALLDGASRRLDRRLAHLRDLDDDAEIVALPPEEQYLCASGRTYFRDLDFDRLQRLQFDLETTGLDASRDRVFMISVRHSDGATELLETRSHDDAGEADLIARLVALVARVDPDVIENHNLHGFDLPFLEQRARRLGVKVQLGRLADAALGRRAARRGVASGRDDGRQVRFVAPGRELIDTMDFVRHYDHSVRQLPGFGLKALARHFGIAGPDRELIPGAEIFSTYLTDPERVRRYATADVEEVAALSRLLGGATFALARMVPRRYERLADAGAATGMIDPILVRAYLRAGQALPAHRPGDGTVHSGAALHLFATGVARGVVKADVASLYPSLMRAYRIGPAQDSLGALLALVDRLVETRLAAKSAGRAAPPGSPERHGYEALSAAMKIVVNSAYGYLAAGGELTRFADVHAANEVTRRGRETLRLMCRELEARGVTLLEADTDGVYFAVPDDWGEHDERRAVSEVAALLPPLVQLELEGRYAAMLSHEPKNYALLGYDGTLTLTGVAFRSRRMEPFGAEFLRRAIRHLLAGEIGAVRDVYLATVRALRKRELSTYDVSSLVRLTKPPEAYADSRDARRELHYEAMLAAGRTRWRVGDRVRVYRRIGGLAGLAPERSEETGDVAAPDRRDYDVDWYTRLLRDTYAARMVRAFTTSDFAVVFPHPDQLSLFTPDVERVKTVLVGEPGSV